MTVFNHVPYEFFQPYLKLLMERYDLLSRDGYALTPAAASLLVAATMLISAFGSRYAIRLRDRLGVPFALLATMALQGSIILCMAAFLHPLIVLLLLLRSMPRALMVPILNATIHPRIHSGIRATFLSLQSFAGRLLFGGALFLTSWFTGLSEALTFPVLSQILFWYAALIAATHILLTVSSGSIARNVSHDKRENDF